MIPAHHSNLLLQYQYWYYSFVAHVFASIYQTFKIPYTPHRNCVMLRAGSTVCSFVPLKFLTFSAWSGIFLSYVTPNFRFPVLPANNGIQCCRFSEMWNHFSGRYFRPRIIRVDPGRNGAAAAAFDTCSNELDNRILQKILFLGIPFVSPIWVPITRRRPKRMIALQPHLPGGQRQTCL